MLVPLTRDAANEFIAQHHRHCGRVTSHRGAIGCEHGGKLVGVAILANPPARALAADPFLVEVVRLCVSHDAPRNTPSWLLARCRRAAVALGFRKVTTVTLDDESGASLRAAGFVQARKMRARNGWTSKSRERGALNTDHRAKVRWMSEAEA